ncbi:MAG: MoaD/ThiS family protein [Gammaproteobacteria bacterium]
MDVLVPGPLRPYTGRAVVDAAGATLGALLLDLDRSHPGIRFRMVDEQDRIRPHIRIFVNGRQIHDLAFALGPRDNVAIVQALSGG